MQYHIGIVLSGGGSRGLAHIGVLEALRENGIEPACISGTSAGALVGALYAAGCTAAEMFEFFQTRSPFRPSKLTLRKAGFVDTEKVVEDLRPYFPEDSFEALGKRLFVTATDLVHGRLEVFSSGPVVRPVVASCSVPLIFTPTSVDGCPFVDGGIISNFPVDPLLGLCDVVLGVYASPLPASNPAGLQSSLAVAQRGLEIGMFHNSRRSFHHCDLVLSPPDLAGQPTFALKVSRSLVETGRSAALARMDEIRALVERGKRRGCGGAK